MVGSRFFLSIISLFWIADIQAQDLNIGMGLRSQIPKIDDALNRVYDSWDLGDKARAKAIADKDGIAMKLTEGTVTVVLKPEMNASAKTIDRVQLRNLGAEILAESEHLMRIRAPIASLVDISKIAGVSFVRKPMRPNLSAVRSEGFGNINAQAIHSQGVRGEGITVGILDFGFEKASQATLRGDLPDDWRYVDYTDEGIETGGVHGTACAEIVHDIAPDAELIFLKVGDLVDFENAKDLAIREGIDIISLSGGWVGAGFGDGLGFACDVVNDAFKNDIVWINAAGNYAEKQYSSLMKDLDSDGFHNFDGDDEVLTLKDVKVGDTIELWLTWNDWPTTTQNYDLILTKSKGDGSVEVLETSETFQLFSEPVEHITYTVTETGDYGIAVWKAEQARSMLIKIFSENHPIQELASIAGTVGTPADAKEAIAVGAIPYYRWTSGPIEQFSSRGPTFDGRIKPDLVAPDAVTTFSYAPDSFYGTSAAAPHVAGVAALIKSSDPDIFDATTIRQKLFDLTIDMGDPGKDNTFGYGRLDLSALKVQPRFPRLELSTLQANFGGVVLTESDTQTVILRNTGDATLRVDEIGFSSPQFYAVSQDDGRLLKNRFDDEDEIASWSTSDNGDFQVADGKLVVNGDDSGFIAWISPYGLFSGIFFNDLDISVKSEWLAGVDNSSFGIRYLTFITDIQYRFFISGNGAYGITKRANNTRIDLVDWTWSPTINENGVNVLRVTALGDSLKFSINGTVVESLYEPDFESGYTNLFLGGNQIISFDDLIVREHPFNYPITLAPSESLQLDVIFRPESETEIRSEMEVRSNDPDGSHGRLALSGSGIGIRSAPIISIANRNVNFGNVVKVGSVGEQNIDIRNLGNGDLKISDIRSSNPAVSITPKAMVIPPNDQKAIKIELKPTTLGKLSSIITIFSDDPEKPQYTINVVADITGFKEPQITNIEYRLDFESTADGNNADDGVREGSVSGAGSKFYVELFLPGATGQMAGMDIQFKTDVDLVRISGVTSPTGFFRLGSTEDYVAFGAIPSGSLNEAGFAGRIEFTTQANVTNRSFNIEIGRIILPYVGSARNDTITIGESIRINPNATPTANFTVMGDLDSNQGNQGILDIRSGDKIKIQLWATGIKDIVGYGAKFMIDSDYVSFDDFEIGSALPNGISPGNTLQDNVLEVTAALLGGQVTVETGLVGTVTFSILKADRDIVIKLIEMQVRRLGQFETLTDEIVFTIHPGKPGDFDGDGKVGFADFLLFAEAFGSKGGDGKYNGVLDIDSDGQIGFSDFLIFAEAFGA